MTKTVCCILVGFFTIMQGTVAQHEGDQWMFGYSSKPFHEYHAVYSMDFRSFPQTFHLYPEVAMWMDGTNASLCDENGELIMWTNGMEIRAPNGVVISEQIASGDYWDFWYLEERRITSGFPYFNGALILKIPGSTSRFQVIYHNASFHPDQYFSFDKLLAAEVRYGEESIFDVVYQDSVIHEPDAWYTESMSATRHANGRDWWIVMFERNTSLYYSFLLSPAGLRLYHVGDAGYVLQPGLAQTNFSPKGNLLVRLDGLTFDQPCVVSVYDFDRCQGNLTFRDSVTLPVGVETGTAVSPNERFLYASSYENIYQWDLEADDLTMSRVHIDSLSDYEDPGWVRPEFGPFVLGVDGRMYNISHNGTSYSAHVIERPDLPGKACMLRQHSLKFPYAVHSTAPNNPNFRLGPLDDSPCDTLGIDNIPVAEWRHEVDDSIDLKTIRFTDLSYYNPETWHWDFDDGFTSNEQHPIHPYAEPGLYHVCLTVSNANATDSACQWVEIDETTSTTFDIPVAPKLQVFPNPFSDQVRITCGDDAQVKWYRTRLIDMHGRVIYDQQMPVPGVVHLERLPPGTYAVVLVADDGEVVDSVVVVKQ